MAEKSKREKQLANAYDHKDREKSDPDQGQKRPPQTRVAETTIETRPEAPGNGDMMARHKGERDEMHRRQHKEMTDMHGAHREEHRAINARHEAEYTKAM